MKLSRIEVMEESQIKKLKEAGVSTIEKLVASGTTQSGRKEIARRSRLSEKLIDRWVKHADLFRIKGVAGLKVVLLEATGVITMKDLAKQNPEKLHANMININNKKQIVERVPGMVQVRRWVTTAKKLPVNIK